MTRHKHDEAFLLIWYACPCAHQERVWNSRDGIIPQAIICSSCGGMAMVPRAAPMEYAPKHQLHHGQKFFRDGTTDEAFKLTKQWADKCIKEGSQIPGEEGKKYTEKDRPALERELMKKFTPGWPCVDVWGKLTSY